jgi:hypothetical protein
MRAIILVVRFADGTIKTRPNLSADADAVTDFQGGHLWSDLDRLANDLVADAKGEVGVSPAASDSVNVTAADAAAFDADINIVVAELFGFEL